MGFPDCLVGKESSCNAGDPSSIPGSQRSAREGIGYPLQYRWASLVAQLVKNLPAMQETWVWSLVLGRSPGEGQGYPLQYSGLKNSMDCIVLGVTKSRTWPSNFHYITLRTWKRLLFEVPYPFFHWNSLWKSDDFATKHLIFILCFFFCPFVYLCI